MEDIEEKKDLNNMNDAPSLKTNKMFYCCSECTSIIEILNIDDEYIEFKCNNNHSIKIGIREYLNKIKEYKDKNILNDIINNSKCDIHKEEYYSYCFECNKHLCEKCLMTSEHSYHYKINIKEIKPKKEIIKEIKNLIKSNKKKIKYLNDNKENIEIKLNDILNKNIKDIKDIKKRIKKRI